MSDLLPSCPIGSGTDKGFVDATGRPESALLAGELGGIRGEKHYVEASISSGIDSRASPTGSRAWRPLTGDRNLEAARLGARCAMMRLGKSGLR